VVVPAVGEETGHPVLFRSTLFPELLEPDLEEGARTVVRRDRDRVLEVQVNDPGVLADLNTLGDYRRHFPGSYRKRFQKW
jgi:molybdenum cofactor cytidylyltransferase